MADTPLRFLWVTALLGFFVYLSSPASAQPESATGATTLERVINSAYRHYPGIRAAFSDIARSEAEATTARGAFDPRLEGQFSSRLEGFYGGDSRQAGLYQPLPYMGAEVFVELNHSDGSFPVYEQQLVTAEQGKARLGIALSLLRDRTIDRARTNLALADIEQQVAGYQLMAERVAVVQQAYVAYARWLVSARLLESYQQLLDFALARDSALQRQVEAGDAAEILLVENRQSILQRRGLVVDAERQLAVAAQELSLFLRDSSGNMRLPVYDPSLDIPDIGDSGETIPVPTLVERSLAASPEVRILDLMQDQVLLERSLAANNLKPRLDLRAYTTRNFGPGQDSLLDSEQVVDLSFSIPLRNRQARGQLSAADARLDGLRHQLRLLRERTETELRNALTSLNAADELLETARQEAEVAATLVEAEARRFEAGLSDFFLLNVRENTLAQARLRRWRSELEYQIALAGYYGLSLDLEALGLAPGQHDDAIPRQE